MVSSRKEIKTYFFPVYVIWAILSPTLMILMQGYVFSIDGSLFEAIDWRRVPSIYALFGLIWPLTIIISPAFYIAFKIETGFTFFTAIANFSDPNAKKMIVASLAFAIAWIGPLIHFLLKLLQHKKLIEQDSEDEKLGWLDYVAGYI